LIASLEGYLNDPNFEQNRIEYKESKDVADGKTPKASSKGKGLSLPSMAWCQLPTHHPVLVAKPASPPPPVPTSSIASSSKPPAKTEPIDFFEGLEGPAEQKDAFGAPTNG
jgi:phosphatidylinositol-binding clathrin assembly protein